MPAEAYRHGPAKRMLILAADTSGKHGSIALAQCEADAIQPVGLVPLEGGTFSAQLVPQISDLLSKHKLSKTNIDAFAVATGPGSFTGLRVGLAAIKALAEILRKPIAPVSLLEAIAFKASNGEGKDGPELVVALDGGRNEVFVGEYRVGLDVPSCLAEYLLEFDELVERSSRLPVYTPDESLVQRIKPHGENSEQSKVIRVPRPDALSVAQLGCNKIRAGLTVSTEELDATYIRRADAEIVKYGRHA